MFSPIAPFPYLLLYLFFLFIRPHEYPGVDAQIAVMPILAGLAGLLAVFSIKKFEPAPPHVFIWGLLFAICMSVAASGWFGGAVQAFGDFLPHVLVFVVAGIAINSLSKLRLALGWTCALLTIIALHSIFQAETGIGWTGAPQIAERSTYIGILGDPNDLANALLFGIPLTLHFMIGKSPLGYRALGIVAFPLLLYGVYLTNSRGAVISVAGMVCAYSFLQYGARRTLWFVPLVLLVLYEFAPSRALEASEADEESSELRIEAWLVGLELFKKSPFFGSGINTFLDHNLHTAHNSFVLAFAELGFVGYFFWFGLVVLSFGMAYQVSKLKTPAQAMAGTQSDLRELNGLARALLCGFAGFMFSAFFISRTYFPTLYFYMGLILAAFQIAQTYAPQLKPYRLGQIIVPLAAVAFGSIVAFWLIVKVLARIV